VRLRELRTRSFRNLAEEDILFADGFNVLVGDNAQGKTSVLEAVFVLGMLNSFRTQKLRQTIRHGETEADLCGRFSDGDIGMEVRVRLDGNGRRVVRDGKRILRIDEHVGTIPMASFTPNDLDMIKGASAVRRRFLDRGCSTLFGGYFSDLSDYRKALKTRNALLKSAAADPRLLASYEEILAHCGARISSRRRELIANIASRLSDAQRLFSFDRPLGIEFRDGFGCEAGDGVEVRMEKLARLRPEDVRRGHTSMGSHRDDFSTTIDGRPARQFGSQGQQRMLTISLLLSLAEEMVRSGPGPILLLDDISSELDSHRRKSLFRELSRIGVQILITTTDERIANVMEGDLCLLRVSEGRVSPAGKGRP